jgi:hypothetical protein
MKLFKTKSDFSGYFDKVVTKYYISTKSGKELEVSKEDAEYSKEVTSKEYSRTLKNKEFLEYIKLTVIRYKENKRYFLELLTSKEYINEYEAFKALCKQSKINPFKTFPAIVKQYSGLNHRLNKAYRNWLNGVWKDCNDEKEIVEYIEDCLNIK